jgi:hypothetical protein
MYIDRKVPTKKSVIKEKNVVKRKEKKVLTSSSFNQPTQK